MRYFSSKRKFCSFFWKIEDLPAWTKSYLEAGLNSKNQADWLKVKSTHSKKQKKADSQSKWRQCDDIIITRSHSHNSSRKKTSLFFYIVTLGDRYFVTPLWSHFNSILGHLQLFTKKDISSQRLGHHLFFTSRDDIVYSEICISVMVLSHFNQIRVMVLLM